MSDFEGTAKIYDNNTAKELGISNYVESVQIPTEVICPDCGAELIPESGCLYCPMCGWSKCK